MPARALRTAMAEANACVSLDLLEEYRAVPDARRANGKITALQFQALVAGIAIFVAEARLVEPTKSIRVCRDPKDDMVLECCLAAKGRPVLGSAGKQSGGHFGGRLANRLS